MTEQQNNLVALSQKLIDLFDWNEMKALAFELNVDWEELTGDNKTTHTQAFVSYVQRRQRISDLIALLYEKRPFINWADFVTSSQVMPHQRETSLERNIKSQNRITAREGGKIRLKKGVFQKGESNSVEADSGGEISAESITQRGDKE